MKNYFEHFGIPLSLTPDKDQLRKLYYQKSRELHPDFHQLQNTDSASSEYETAFNNQAYKTLNDPLLCLKYALELEDGPLSESNVLDQNFLMSLLELHEAIFEAKEIDDQATLEQLKLQLDQMQSDIQTQIDPAINAFNLGNRTAETIDSLKVYYNKLNYFVRLRQAFTGNPSEL